jgi:hypothetical protein
MFPTFHGRIEDGRLRVSELGQYDKILEGKHLAVIPLELNDMAQVVGGSVIAGVYESGGINTVSGKEELRALEGRPVMVIIRHELMGTTTPDVFASRFQLGAKPVEMDN